MAFGLGMTQVGMIPRAFRLYISDIPKISMQIIRCVRQEMNMIKRFGFFVVLILAGFVATGTLNAYAEPLSAQQIMERAAAHSGGDDGVARVTFQVHSPGQEDATIRYAMAWKHFPVGHKYSAKVLFFPEAPASLKGKAYMGFIAPAGSELPDEEWMYIPELRQIRKMTHKQHHHHHGPEDLFSRSLLNKSDMAPRLPQSDRHTLLRTEQNNGDARYVIASTPKTINPAYPYARVVTWVSVDHYLPVESEYFDADGKLVKRVSRTWTQVNDTWMWERVTAEDQQGSARTVLTQTDIRVNTGLKDRAFSQRAMKQGPGRLF